VEWQEHQTGKRSPVKALLLQQGANLGDFIEFDRRVGDWRLVRFALSRGEISDWLQRLIAWDQVPLPNGDSIRTNVGASDILARWFPFDDRAPAGHLAAALNRPILGWLHSLDDGRRDVAVSPPEDWDAVPGRSLLGATVNLLGIGFRAPRSLLVGRAGRIAWFRTLRGNPPDLRELVVTIGLDPTRISAWELAIEIEERTQSRDLVSARRLALADLVLPAHGPESLDVVLPVSGAGLTRSVRLYADTGLLLDCAKVTLLESIRINGRELGVRSSSDLRTRLAAIDSVESAYGDLLRAGAHGRVVATGEGPAGISEIASRLMTARGEVLIFDPYFGNADTSVGWDLLDTVAVPARVLGGADMALPIDSDTRWPDIDFKRWKTNPPKFHDRAYLWDGGGIVVGTSADGLGKRLSLIDRVEPAVAQLLSDHFEAWWSGSEVERI
jgi:hypothetical protein